MYAIVDIETTGGSAANSGITEIAIHVHDGNRVVQHFTTLLNPEKTIPHFITALTGISNAMVASAPTFKEMAKTIFELLSNNIFVAHNVNFDYSFIFHHLKLCGYDLKVNKLCTVRLARKALPGYPSYSLGKICRSLNINIDDRHRADGDAAATVILFNKILEAGGMEHINKMLKRTSSEQWLPLHLDKNKIQQLPITTGVYYFHDAKGKVIYVGKAINIRKRVSSHFTNNDTGSRRQNFVQLVNHISYKDCANELHALILESTEIKRLWPKYNYAQKQPLQKYALYSFEDNRGYMRLAIDKKQKNLPAVYSFNLLHEGQVLLRKMMEEFELNEKLCFVNKEAITIKDLEYMEDPQFYNERVKNAIHTLQKQLPTFALLDDGINKNEKLCFLIEKGNFWGMGFIASDTNVKSLAILKEALQPFTDNDFIRNSIYNYVEENPHKKVIFE
ncbi:MAG: exonuclease domain-containing protein [Ferruginibacter sp.]|nr:GIY-YIG nuclease family protein [Ferruginibacter sp.]